jgi:hypothetical protein
MTKITSLKTNFLLVEAIERNDRSEIYRLTSYCEQESAYASQDREVWGTLARMGRNAL